MLNLETLYQIKNTVEAQTAVVMVNVSSIWAGLQQWGTLWDPWQDGLDHYLVLDVNCEEKQHWLQNPLNLLSEECCSIRKPSVQKSKCPKSIYEHCPDRKF